MISPRATGRLFSLLGVGFLGIASLMATDQLPRNGLVGMRTGATMTSDAAWNAAHRASAWSVALAGLVLLAAGVWLMLARRSARASRTVEIGTVIAMVAAVIVGGIQADQVAKDTTSATRR